MECMEEAVMAGITLARWEEPRGDRWRYPRENKIKEENGEIDESLFLS